MLEDRKILVTGATGQIAGPIAENFAKDNEVWCAARFSDPKRKAELEEMGIKTCVWDMDSGDASMLPTDCTHVVHSALHVSPDYDESITNNAEASALLMQHCRKAEAFLHVSSSCVYRRHENHPHHAYAETDPPVASRATRRYTRSSKSRPRAPSGRLCECSTCPPPSPA